MHMMGPEWGLCLRESQAEPQKIGHFLLCRNTLLKDCLVVFVLFCFLLVCFSISPTGGILTAEKVRIISHYSGSHF